MISRCPVGEVVVIDRLTYSNNNAVFYSGFLKSRFEQICQIERAGRTLKGTVSFLRHQTLAR